ncbi:MAG: hypothetical protein K8R31_02755 [Bacteroidales bacterium]|nr:hypothetical protein [Bacteroidales bacterium]
MKTFFLISFAVFTSMILNAQDNLKDITAPTSPASSVLGIESSTVLTPKSYQALETALYSNFLNEDGSVIIPNDFALEFTPYWTKNHGLSLEEYLYPKSLVDQLIRSSSFSLASTQNFLLGDSTKTNGIAFGYRATFFIGNKNDRKTITKYRDKLAANQLALARIGAEAELLVLKDHINNKSDFIKGIENTITSAIKSYVKDISQDDAEKYTKEIFEDVNQLPELNKDNPDSFLDSLYRIVDSNIDTTDVFEKFKSYINKRQGFSLDVAYGILFNFPTNNFEFSYGPRQSFWLTPTYRFKDEWSKLKAMAVLRYEWYNTDYYKRYFPDATVYENNFSYGIAIAGEFKKFTLQFEYVGRSSNSETPTGAFVNGKETYTKDTYSDIQYSGTFSYRLSDQLVISYSLGKQFEPIMNPENTLISLLSLNYGFGSPTKENLKK